MRDTLIQFITTYQSDSLHGPCEIRFTNTALDLNISGSDKVLYWSTPQGPPTILTIADGVDAFLHGAK